MTKFSVYYIINFLTCEIKKKAMIQIIMGFIYVLS
jgi:hypothetical protein